MTAAIVLMVAWVALLGAMSARIATSSLDDC
jgi:hypothetical protein